MVEKGTDAWYPCDEKRDGQRRAVMIERAKRIAMTMALMMNMLVLWSPTALAMPFIGHLAAHGEVQPARPLGYG